MRLRLQRLLQSPGVPGLPLPIAPVNPDGAGSQPKTEEDAGNDSEKVEVAVAAVPMIELTKFSNDYGLHKASLLSGATLSQETLLIVEQVGSICAATTYAYECIAADFLSQFSEDIVMDFENLKPVSIEVKRLCAFQDLVFSFVPSSSGVWATMPQATAKTFFDSWVPQFKVQAHALMNCMQDIVMKSEVAKKLMTPPEGGWPDTDQEKIFAQMEALSVKLTAFQPRDQPLNSGLAHIQGMMKEIQRSTDVGLTEDELATKSVLQDRMTALMAQFPTMSKDKLLKCSMEEIDSELTGKQIGAYSTQFMEKVNECTHDGATITLSQLGSNFAKKVEDVKEYVMIVLACQSALKIIKTGDATKAAEFEAKRLQPRGISLSQLPESVQNTIQGLAKQ